MANTKEESQNDVDDFIKTLADAHPEYTMAKFKFDFNEAMSRIPTLKDFNNFLKLIEESHPLPSLPVGHSILQPTVQIESIPKPPEPRPKSKRMKPKPKPEQETEDIPKPKRVLKPPALPIFFTPQLEGGECFTDVDGSWRTYFQDTQISEGVFRWSVKIKYGDNCFSIFEIGAMQTELLTENLSFPLGITHGSCSFEFHRDRTGLGGTALRGVMGEADSVQSYLSHARGDEHYSVDDGSVVTVEINAVLKTMSFFVNKMLVKRGVSELLTPLNMGISGMTKGCKGKRPCFKSLSFQKLPSTVPSYSCSRLYEYLPGSNDGN